MMLRALYLGVSVVLTMVSPSGIASHTGIFGNHMMYNAPTIAPYNSETQLMGRVHVHRGSDGLLQMRLVDRAGYFDGKTYVYHNNHGMLYYIRYLFYRLVQIPGRFWCWITGQPYIPSLNYQMEFENPATHLPVIGYAKPNSIIRKRQQHQFSEAQRILVGLQDEVRLGHIRSRIQFCGRVLHLNQILLNIDPNSTIVGYVHCPLYTGLMHHRRVMIRRDGSCLEDICPKEQQQIINSPMPAPTGFGPPTSQTIPPPPPPGFGAGAIAPGHQQPPPTGVAPVSTSPLGGNSLSHVCRKVCKTSQDAEEILSTLQTPNGPPICTAEAIAHAQSCVWAPMKQINYAQIGSNPPAPDGQQRINVQLYRGPGVHCVQILPRGGISAAN